MAGTLFGSDAIPAGSKNEVRWWTAHCDGGSRGNPGPAAFGAVIVDPEGRVAAEISEFLGTATNNVAEYRGLLATLDWAVAQDARALRVVSDSLLMVQQVKGRYKVNSPDLRTLWQAARDRIARLDRFEIEHALRHKNKEADRLANEAMDRGTGKPAAGRPAGQSEARGGSGDRAGSAVRAGAESIRTKSVRGFVRDGAVHLLDGASLPEGAFVKVVVE